MVGPFLFCENEVSMVMRGYLALLIVFGVLGIFMIAIRVVLKYALFQQRDVARSQMNLDPRTVWTATVLGDLKCALSGPGQTWAWCS
jgi:hypothetical protein